VVLTLVMINTTPGWFFSCRRHDERRFSGPAALVEQLVADVDATRRIWAASGSSLA
jgi:hypothetical protein